MGVKRAVEFVLKTAGEYPGPIFTWGPLIHNPQTVDFLKEQGVDVIDTPSEIPKDSTVVIRSHGISPEERKAIVDSGASICDATCPKVARVQGLIKRPAKRKIHAVLAKHVECTAAQQIHPRLLICICREHDNRDITVVLTQDL